MSPQRFRKRPVVIEAYRVADLILAATSDWAALPPAVVAAYEAADVLFMPDHIEIRTLEGWHLGGREDWIIQGVEGELYPCKPSIFEATYEAVTDE